MTLAAFTFLIPFGFIPSLVWLFYYLRKDCHPEPKSLIARSLFLGMLVAPLAAIGQLVFNRLGIFFNPGYQASASVLFFLWAAFLEEYIKYFAVKLSVINKPDFDEPTDAMIYMISAALGFAALENILILFQTIPSGIGAAVQIWLLRFSGATLLHAVSSAILGYFLALSWFYWRHNRKLIYLGLALATFSHLTFNVLLLSADSQQSGFFHSSLVVIALVILISLLFNRLKKRFAC